MKNKVYVITLLGTLLISLIICGCSEKTLENTSKNDDVSNSNQMSNKSTAKMAKENEQNSSSNEDIVEKVTLKDYKPSSGSDCSQGEVVAINKLKEIIKKKPEVTKIILDYTILYSEKNYIKIVYERNEKILKRYSKSESKEIWALWEYKNVSDKEIFNATVIDGGDLGSGLFSQVYEPVE